ncbi:extracellular matrix protein FRAS1-like [Limulus polyphemus]|uniref:Extracellular matrix protein FRAS1-like n=1 Tax=Limulus polyphemus TaxID=6850 RepID=A0ABM1C5I5_LIMPO|nr:extracellular matrix protein FRAS1-like [Limulus polyphemus]
MNGCLLVLVTVVAGTSVSEYYLVREKYCTYQLINVVLIALLLKDLVLMTTKQFQREQGGHQGSVKSVSVQEDGSQWISDPCTHCSCQAGEVVCVSEECLSETSCEQYTLFKRPNECCPSCVSSESPCIHGNNTFYSGDIWNISSCEFCVCSKGKISCSTAFCETPQCSSDENLAHVSGKCCPECVQQFDLCFVEDRIYKPGEQWVVDKCTLGACYNGQIIHFKHECPSCPVGSAAVEVKGQCCPLCKPVKCSGECSSCLEEDPNYCLACKDQSKLLEEGYCVFACSQGYFQDSLGYCQSCHTSCHECFGEGEDQCLTCQSGLIFKARHCVTREECGPSHTISNGVCIACHSSCKNCRGPSEYDCLSCFHNSYLLMNGQCVEKCNQGFYVEGGHCQACESDCESCYKDKPYCRSCKNGKFLQEEHCVDMCSRGMYSTKQGYCIPCHPLCGDCAGPFSTNCTSCYYGRFLREQSCVEECGPGYYKDTDSNTCQACHPTCRYCAGGRALDQCLSCSTGHLVTYPGVSYGYCLDDCPDKYFLSYEGKCESCHESCQTCLGSNLDECSTCKSPKMLKNGLCVEDCGTGFYHDAGICRACHPNCATCYGWGADECTSCHGDVKSVYGRCQISCLDGTYLDTDGICKDCHRDCITCVLKLGASSPECIACKDEEKFPQGGRCVSKCDKSFFLNEHMLCEKCHPSCLTCDIRGVDGCTSCPPSAVLSHNGICLNRCLEGYYDVGGTCHACDYNCLRCSIEGRCEQCRDKLVLQFGECVGSCYAQYYIDHISGECRECSWNCNTCSGPFPYDCLSCMGELLLQDGECRSHCSEGYYQDGYLCKVCSSDCLTCSDRTLCTSCRPPLLLLDSECVASCGPGYYPQYGSHTCRACSTGCTDCPNPLSCDHCAAGYFMLENSCVNECGSGYFEDHVNRVCERNQVAPQLVLNGSLLVDFRAPTPIDTSFITASDPDTHQKDLAFVVVTTPNNGDLLRHTVTEMELINVGDVLPFDEVASGLIKFRHKQNAPWAGKFQLKVSDRQLDSSVNVIPVQVVSRYPPEVNQLRPLLVEHHGNESVTTNILQVSDQDNLENLVFYVLEGPKHGKLVDLPKLSEVFSFSWSALKRGSLHYIHDGSMTQYDLMILQISDGYNVKLSTLNIQILPAGNKGPVLVTNEAVKVKRGSSVQLTSANLQTTDPDTGDENILFTVTKGKSVREGTLVRRSPDTQNFNDQQVYSEVKDFTQKDINDGVIWYQNSGTEATVDGFEFQVSDDARPPNTISKQIFRFDIISPPDDKQINLGIMVMEHHAMTISSSQLSFIPRNFEPHDVVYHITKHLAPGQGTLEHIDYLGQPIGQFTQGDVDDMKIIYRPPERDIGPKEELFSFKFFVSDRRGNKLLPEQTFVVKVIPKDKEPPKFARHKLELRVNLGAFVLIPQSVFSVKDPDTSLEKLEVSLSKEPEHGVFLKHMDGKKVPVLEGEPIPYKDTVKNQFSYAHDNSQNYQDELIISVSDGKHSSSMTLDITILPVDTDSPAVLDSASLTLTIPEGQSIVLQRSHLAYEDRDSPDSQISFTLTTTPKLGKLEKLDPDGNFITLKEGYSLTQQDINDFSVRFIANPEIGMSPTTELIYFNVTGIKGNVKPNQALSISVTPVNNQAPHVMVKEDIQVTEGGSVFFTPDLFSVLDHDSPLANLTVVIDVEPTFGYIDSSKSNDHGLEMQAAGIPVSSFPMEDVMNRYIRYNQIDHRNKEPTEDAFLFHVTDGLLESPISRINVSIQLENDEPPVIFVEPLPVVRKGFIVVRNSSLYAGDIDTSPEDLLFTLVNPPKYGTLRLLQTPSQPPHKGSILTLKDAFTYEEVLEELVMYIHDGNKKTNRDNFTLTLSDGQFLDTKTLEILVTSDDTETPRMLVNRGMKLQAGSTAVISPRELLASDLDSEDKNLRYTLTQDPPTGKLILRHKNNQIPLSSRGPVASFNQQDIELGNVHYVHKYGEPTGTVPFRFQVSDPIGNLLMDQTFVIMVIEDKVPPVVTTNTGITLPEGTAKQITTNELAAIDSDSEPALLHYDVIVPPTEGVLEMLGQPMISVTSFLQADLASGRLIYVHNIDSENGIDSFTFTVSDGVNNATHTFHITITPIDDTLPLVTASGLRVQEGVRKLITEFELKAADLDSKDTDIMFSIVKLPKHGTIELQGLAGIYSTTTAFSMDDIYENRVSYQHDGSNSLKDEFYFTVSDGTNPLYTIQKNGDKVTTGDPSVFSINVLPVDDGTPILTANLGIQYLEIFEGKPMNAITKRDLLTEDADTRPEDLLYTVTQAPIHGHLELASNPGSPVLMFSQNDINTGMLRYILTDASNVTSDKFVFNVEDAKPNIISENVFHVRWARISFSKQTYNISESSRMVQLKVKRSGNLKQYSIVQCATRDGTANFNSNHHSSTQDFVPYSGQVQFEEWEDEKFCTVFINDDSVYEGVEDFTVELSSPSYALLGQPTVAKVFIDDIEDEPLISFEEQVFHINETDSYLFARVRRTGDVSHAISAICYTIPLTADGSQADQLDSGADFRSRPNNEVSRVVFPSGVTRSSCDVKIIDDSLFEDKEEFEIVLTSPSSKARIGNITKALVVIDGPNDESLVYLAQSVFLFNEEAGEVEIEVIREGPDLSQPTIVWCGTLPSDPSSALPGQDYVPSSIQITFGVGQTSAGCPVSILDDLSSPQVEGNETFIVFLSTPIGSSLADPAKAFVIISDSLSDLPVIQFKVEKLVIKESSGIVQVPVVRTGDLSSKLSVLCYTLQKTAYVREDFEERPKSDLSKITFFPGEKSKNCVVSIVDDARFEDSEYFLLKLGNLWTDSAGGAIIGSVDTVRVTITNQEDVSTLNLDQSTYTVQEPSKPDQIAKVMLKIVRKGDNNQTCRVRVSTRDGSATSGVDYHAKSKLLIFPPGAYEQIFEVEILYNKEREWHKMFTVVLGPDEPVNAEIGEISVATVTISDHEAAGSGVLPASPIVVSLLHYDNVEEGTKTDPSPGYPLICVTPCDPHYPGYALTGPMCKDAGINHSAIHFNWEVALPTDIDGSRPPFETVRDSTLFTSAHHMVLDSIYFSRRFLVRCSAQPKDANGHLGVPLRSNIAQIGIDNGICHTPIAAGQPYLGLQSQSFVATLRYVNSSHKYHPNRLHIHVEIPHQDGMLPLISTLPIHNIRFLLTEPVYRQQHICSNLLIPVLPSNEPEGSLNYGFLEPLAYKNKQLQGPGFNRPYQFDQNLRAAKSLSLYQHLDLKSCVWTFDAWYHMTELIDLCGGSVTSDFQMRDSAQSYLTVELPLHVSYIYATAPTGWASIEHRTEMEFSFFYNTVLWRTGLETDGILRARLQILRISVGADGRLILEFKTEAKFRGQFVMKHHTLPGVESGVLPPDTLVITFDLELIWTESTFDGPSQLWRATSNYNLKDYTGQYIIQLIPCTVKPTQSYASSPDKPLVCTAHLPERFEVPIAFQQTNRPVPVIYSLNTVFQLLNNQKMFLMPPTDVKTSLQDIDYKGTFSKGQTVYGRVLWNPEQDLESAYKLQIERLYMCTGRDGYIPTYDPTGEDYNEGLQFGCIQPNKNLKHRFLILDRNNPEAVDKHFHDIPFKAKFASDDPTFESLAQLPGVDGFLLKVDALYKVNSGHQWYLQVMYTIGPSDGHRRVQRSATLRFPNTLTNLQAQPGILKKNGTNMKALYLNMSNFEVPADSDAEGTNFVAVFVPLVLLLLLTTIVVIVIRRRKLQNQEKQFYEEENKNNIRKAMEQKLADTPFLKTKMNCYSDNLNSKANNSAKVSFKGINVTVRNNLQQPSSLGGTEV